MKRAQLGKGASRPVDRPAFGAGTGAGIGAFGGTSLSYLAQPPSFAAVSDPHVVVSFKNILKKDSTTKTKGLEDLLQHVLSHPYDDTGGVDEAVLDIWTQLYPRLSIDNARRVRELSHTLQFELVKSARKRMERRIPKVVGAWLSGLYDRDRAVARAANDGLSSFLTTPEKMSAFWSRCQTQILDYAIEAVRETQDTLSDERSTTSEDADVVYFRVLTASMSLVLGLIQLRGGDLESFREKYDEYFAEEAVWKSITFKDQHARRIVCQLLFACLERDLPYAESVKVKQAFVTGGLKTSQAGSALEYVRALTKLTQRNPDIWLGGPADKKSPFARLQSFIAKGSQGSPPKYWECLDSLLALIPQDLLTSEGASGLLASLKLGIASRDEPRTNTSFSWKCFDDSARRCLKALSEDDQLILARQHLFPLFEQFFFTLSEHPTSIPLGPNSMTIVVDIHLGLLRLSSRLAAALAAEWGRLGDMLCSNISGSLPGVSKGYQESQSKISEEARRWFGLVGLLYDRLLDADKSLDQTVHPSTKIISQCINILKSRNMKPFGAAQALEYALSTSPHLFVADTGVQLADFLQSSALESMETVVQSASSPSLFSCLGLLAAIPEKGFDYDALWKLWTASSLKLDSSARISALICLVSQERASSIAQSTEELQDAVCSQVCSPAVIGGDAVGISTELVEAAVTHNAVNPETIQKIVLGMVKRLSIEAESKEALDVLEIIAKQRKDLFRQEDPIRTELVAHLLSLSELADSTVSLQASRIRSLLDGPGHGALPVVEILQSNLDHARPQSLEISTLVSQAKGAAGTNISWEHVFPSTNVWMAELSPMLEVPLNPSLAITSSIGGALSLPKRALTSPPSQLRVSRDRKGRSVPARMAIFTAQLLSTTEGIVLPRQQHIELLYLQILTVHLASDQITLLGHNGLWENLDDDEAMNEAENLVTSSRTLLSSFLAEAKTWDLAADDRIAAIIQGLINFTIKESSEISPRGVYSSRVLSELLQELSELHGDTASLEEQLLRPDILKATPQTALPAAGIVAGLGEKLQSSKAVINFCNRLISDISAASLSSDRTIITLVLTTMCAQLYGQGELPVANNRIVFAVKQITSWMDDAGHLDANVCAEMCRALAHLLPCMKDVYGSYWEKSLQFCVSLWERAGQQVLSEALPSVHSSLKLFKVLEGIQEPNDDLQDALRDFSTAKSNGLVELLKLRREENSQPLEIVDAMLRREIETMPVLRIPDPVDLFPLVASESRDIQTAAFEMLHKKIPIQQEQQAFDILLEKKVARLPDELLSLLLDPPTLDKFSDEALAVFPSSIRCYLLSWKLLFDAFSASTFKIRNDYTEHLKSGDYVNPLLEFLFDVLGHSAAHPIKLDKENIGPQQICDFDIKLADAEPGERSMYWLLAHSFYLTLKYIPSLFRAWYLDCRSKQTRIAVETWTTKFFSPLIIADTLAEVQAWADSQEAPPSDEKELVVKVSRAAREVTAGYEVDEEQALIVIKVPSSYPIDGITVLGQHRVAVTERKWQSWIMTTQGAITFSNGSIMDGLQVFRRNIVGALKGQTECAICYSIISSDKRTPDKRCSTCKNLFHRSCLYKWFQTSNQNSCPLCRNPIDYLGADTAKRRQ
ncbi:C3HC4 type zinc finger containing protein [Drechmeria coniospora]|uniref:E3 ubiquitin-protein ligase listerin n=1 Tax=Drechmeria coniospora TaxID=98403 RepID=A0A151GW12_DRECN|nr:C3HC4 type zinc finger containing protein [Drechmeria coniospora]KYK61296.1 C3HC4 type zinc finger containing protein [Drechmeria coniospora]